MKIPHREILDSLRENDPPCNPTASNFSNYRKNVEEFIIQKTGFHRGNVSKASLDDLHSVADSFTRKARKIWAAHKSTYSKVVNDEFFSKDLEITVTVTREEQTAKPASTSTTKKQPFRRRAPKKAFDEKSERAQRQETAQLRSNYPSGAITKAAGQVLRQSGQGDSAHVMKRMLDDPSIGTKARKAIKLDEPCKF